VIFRGNSQNFQHLVSVRTLFYKVNRSFRDAESFAVFLPKDEFYLVGSFLSYSNILDT